MTDYNELKKLAEAATRPTYHCDDTPNLRYAVPDIALSDFIAAANPAIVLQMIAHISHQEQRIAELEGALKSGREMIAYSASGMTHSGEMTNRAIRILATVDSAIANSSKDQQDNGTEEV